MTGSNAFAKSLARRFVAGFSLIEYHEVWEASSLLHPDYRALSMIRDPTERSTVHQPGVRLIQKLNVASRHLQYPPPLHLRLHRIFFSEKSQFTWNTWWKSLQASKTNTPVYTTERFSASTLIDITQPLGGLRYWPTKRSAYIYFTSVSLWLLTAPVWSVPSERNCSVLNWVLPTDQNPLEDDTVEDIAFEKSFFDFKKRIGGSSEWWYKM